MSLERVAVVFDNTVRPETTGFYCRRALACLVEVEHFLPSQLDHVRAEDFDLFLVIDDGLRYHLPDHLRPAAIWVIDTHMDFQWSLERAKRFDFVFAAQRMGAERLQSHGCDRVWWLPLACDSELHISPAVDNQFDVAFAGNVFPGPREELLNLLKSEFPRTFVGQRYLHEMAQTYAASHIVFNRSVGDDVNMRVFEALASGSLLVTNDLPESGQRELFADGRHLITYASADELREKIRYYLTHDDEREQIAQRGRALVLDRHTYLHRVLQLLRTIESSVIPESKTLAVSMNPSVSACLVSWQRPDNVRLITEQLRANQLIDDIVIWNNNPNVSLEFDDPRITVIESQENLVTYGRFQAAQHARHDVIYTQDDDCLVENIDQLFETFCLDPSRIAHGLKLGHLCANASNLVGPGQVALLGWGALFDRRWIACFQQYTARFGEDQLLHRKADRIFSLLLGRRHRSILSYVRDLDGSDGGEALSVRSDHMELTSQAISRVLSIWNSAESLLPDSAPATENASMIPSQQSAKGRAYFAFARPELLALVPESAARVLDVGCGVGMLGESIKSRQSAEVTGIELDEFSAVKARERLDRVICGDVERELSALSGELFDCIVFGDVLEHLAAPRGVLKHAASMLAGGGAVVASIPNVAHHSVISSLLEGNWTYEPAGLLDDTHLRFFTRREIEKLFYRSGLEVEALEIVPGDGYTQWKESGCPSEVQFGAIRISGLAPDRIEEFYAYQYLVRAGHRHRQNAHTNDGIHSLRAEFPWPEFQPMVPHPETEQGWLADGSQSALCDCVGSDTPVVVELGAWLGLSTRYIADLSPAATVITIDHWEGSREHHTKPQWVRLLPNLYDTFLNLTWDYRDRVIPVRQTVQAGLRTLARHSVSPDVIYFDAEHSFEAVSADIRLARDLFPQALLVGDDLDDPGVGRAVECFASDADLEVHSYGERWRAWRIDPQLQSLRESTARVTPEYGLTSIVIVTHNEFAYTRGCLASIRYFTDEPYELIVVDNGSTDGTPQQLAQEPDIRLIANAENLGFPAAANQGIRCARGNQVLLLNNDTLVTTGWLQRLLDCLHSDASVGLVGPVSNAVSGEQQVAVSYSRLESLDGFAWDWAKRHSGHFVATDRLVGFCLLIARDVIEQVGLLDERFGIGNFEDDDYCRRARSAGFVAMIASDAYVHHFGSVTFRSRRDIDLAHLLQENERKYKQKWNPTSKHVESNASAPEKPVLPDATIQNPLVLEAEIDPEIGLSLCMIARDNEETIRACLESIKPWIDEMIVVDTGSLDSTPDICKEFGARLYHFPWCDDFSAARNESLKRAKGQWVFWMDTDDTIPEQCGRRLQELAYSRHPDHVGGYTVQVRCLHQDASDMTVVDHLKLFRNGLGIRFELPIHEQVIPSIRALNLEIAFTDIYVDHHGSDPTPEIRARKLERDFRILNAWKAREPDHEYLLFCLGMTHADVDEHEEAIRCLRRSISRSRSEQSHLRKAYSLLASSLAQLARPDESKHVCETGLRLFPGDKELLFRLAIAYGDLGKLESAVEMYLKVLKDPEDRHFTSVDPGIAGCKARFNLGVTYRDLGWHGDAIEQWSLDLKERPNHEPTIAGLTDLLLELDELEVLEEFFGARIASPRAAIDYWIAARRLEASAAPAAAIKTLHAGKQRFPDSIELLTLQGRLLFQYDRPSAAIPALQELADINPHPRNWHNLAKACADANQWRMAEHALREALRLEPDWPAVWIELVQLLLRLKQFDDAVTALQEGLRSCNDKSALAAILAQVTSG